MLAQLYGVISLTTLVTVFFYVFPSLFFVWYGAMLGAVIGGLQVFYGHYKQYMHLQKVLAYIPTGKYLEQFEGLARDCGLQVHTIAFRYAYTAGQIAMTAGNIVIIDPTLCSLADGDVTSGVVKDIFKQHIEPTLSQNLKFRFAQHKELLTPIVQEFLIKHEIGHVVSKFSEKSLLVYFLQAIFAVYMGIITAQQTFGYGIGFALVFGAGFGYLSDIVSSLAVNILFRYFAEKQADTFAAQYSSVEQIKSAADFFIEHQKIADQYNELGFIMKKLPAILVSGHMEGNRRAAYLWTLAEEKSERNKH